MDVTPTFLADVLGLSRARISQLRKDGIIEGDGHPLKYDLGQSVQSYIAYVRESSKRPSEDADAEKRKLVADAEYREIRAREAEIRLGELEGRMHSAEDVEAATTELVYAVRDALLALPGRVGVSVVGKTAAEAADVVRGECSRILGELAGFRYDPATYAKMVRERRGWQVGDDED